MISILMKPAFTWSCSGIVGGWVTAALTTSGPRLVIGEGQLRLARPSESVAQRLGKLARLLEKDLDENSEVDIST